MGGIDGFDLQSIRHVPPGAREFAGQAARPSGPGIVIRPCGEADFQTVLAVVNDAAEAYRGVIPEDCWHEPYMSADELRREISAGVAFRGWIEEGRLVGVMGIQDLGEVALIRHAYVETACRGRGIGGELMNDLRHFTELPLLVGTWAAAEWAIRFYQKHGFRLTTPEEKDYLLRRYWSIPERQIETSVVLAEAGRRTGLG